MNSEMLYIVTALVLAVFISEYAARQKWINHIISRKLLHLFAGSTVLWIMAIVEEKELLFWLGAFFTIFLFVIIKFGILKEVNPSGRKSWGIVLFPLSFSILIYFSKSDLTSAVLAFSIMTFADAFAAIIGIKFAKKEYYLGKDKKSFLGSTIFFLTTSLILVTYFLVINSTISLHTAALIFSISMIITLIEAISSSGSDNFFVPIFSFILIQLLIINEGNSFIVDSIFGFILGALVAALSNKFKVLTKDGAIATLILAYFIYGFGGLKWTLPIFTFFILSSLLSRIRHSKNRKVEDRFEKTGNRDAMQVIANGGVGLFLVVLNSFFNNELFYIIFVLYIAVMCADTWATEIGTYFQAPTYNIRTFKIVESGVSGGVSMPGLVGSLAGGMVILLSSFMWINNFVLLAVMLTLSFIGSLIDSFMGATIQVQHKCNICKLVTEKDFHCDQKTDFYKGLSFINNDSVNFLSGLLTCILFFIWIYS